MGKKQFSIATRYDRALAKEENATIARVNTRLEQAFSSINGELTTYYENLQGEGSLTAQMRVRRSEELKTVLTRIDPSRGAQYEREFEQLITTATQTGRTLGDELLTSYQSDLVGQFTNIPYQAIAAQARDGAIRLSKHTEAFQDKASAVIEMGLVQGKSSKWMQRELRNQLGVTKSKAESIARTESASAFNTAAQARYKAGGVDGIQVMITPSDRVCPFCAARNGNVYKHGAIAVPFHVRCRCVTIPWDSTWQRLGLTDDEFVKDYRDKGLKDLRSLGLQPDYGLAPFERANKMKTVPVAIWKPGEAVLNPTKKIVAPKPTPAPTPPPQPAPAPIPEPIQPAPQPVAPPAPTPAPIPSAAKMPGAKTIQGVKERKLPQIKGQKDFETYLRAHAADIDETYNRGGLISLVELEQRMSLHGVKPETFRAALLDTFDDSFSLGNNSSNPAYMVNGLERNTLTIINKSKFTDKKTLSELERWHKSLKGATTGEIIDSFDGFRQAAGDFIDKAAPMNGNLTEIYQVRRNLGDRVTRREFNEWMRELQEKDLIQLMGGSLTNASPENLADSIRGANGGARFYAKKLNLNEKLNVPAPAKAAAKTAKAAPKPKAAAKPKPTTPPNIPRKPERAVDFVKLGRSRHDDILTEADKINKTAQKARDKYNAAFERLKTDFTQEAQIAFKEAATALDLSDKAAFKKATTLHQQLRDRLISAGNKSSSDRWAETVLIKDSAALRRPVAELRRELSEFDAMTGGKARTSLSRLEYIRDRAFADETGVINIGNATGAEGKKNLFHEAGHHIEFSEKRFFKAADEFLQARAKTKKLVPMYPDRPDIKEVRYPGQFVDDYVSRVYFDDKGKRYEATEVISVGLEHFAKPETMAHLYKRDPDMFELILGVIESD